MVCIPVLSSGKGLGSMLVNSMWQRTAIAFMCIIVIVGADLAPHEPRAVTPGATMAGSVTNAAPQGDWEFNTDGDFEGWTPGSPPTTITATVSGGSLNLAGHGPSAQSPDNLGLDAARRHVIKLAIRNPNSGSLTGFIYFTTTTDPSFDGAKLVTFPLQQSNGYTEYTVDMGANSQWTGTIKQLQLNLDTATNTTGVETFNVDYVRVIGTSGTGAATPTGTPSATTSSPSTATPLSTPTTATTVTVDDATQGSGPYQFNYTGGWTHNGSNGCCYNQTYSEDHTAGDNVTLAFTGTGVTFHGLVINNGGIGEIAILSGNTTVVSATVDFFAANNGQGDTPLYSSPMLPYGAYTFTLRVTGGKDVTSLGASVYPDRLDIGGVASAAPPTPTPPAPVTIRVADDWEFNTDGNVEGWTTGQTTSATVSGGALNISGNAPYAVSPKVSVDAATFPYIKIGLRYPNSGPPPTSYEALADVYFTTADDQTFNASKLVAFRTDSGDSYVEYTVAMKGSNAYTGTITSIRIDPGPEPPNAPGPETYNIDYVRVTNCAYCATARAGASSPLAAAPGAASGAAPLAPYSMQTQQVGIVSAPGWDIFRPQVGLDYRYGPSIIINPDRSIDMWTCSPGQLNQGAADTIRYLHSTDDGHTFTPGQIVLTATVGSQDQGSNCDPSVVRFPTTDQTTGQTTTYYYIAYTGIAVPEAVAGTNNVFVARSLSPTGPFDKWNGSGWGGANPQPFILYTDSPANYGAGEPSMVVKDGTLYIYYTWTESGHSTGDPLTNQTRVSTASATDPNWPAHVSYQGVAIDREGAEDSLDVKYVPALGTFVGVDVANRLVTQNSFIKPYESTDGIHFTRSYFLDGDNQQFAISSGSPITYSSNIGISGNQLGHLDLTDHNFVSYIYDQNFAAWNLRLSPITVGLVYSGAFADDFAQGARNWTPQSGVWSAGSGIYQGTDTTGEGATTSATGMVVGAGTYETDLRLNATTPLSGGAGFVIGQVHPGDPFDAGGYTVLLRPNGDVALYKAGEGQVVADTPTGTGPTSGFVHLRVVKGARDIQVYVGDTPQPQIDWPDEGAPPFVAGAFSLLSLRGSARFAHMDAFNNVGDNFAAGTGNWTPEAGQWAAGAGGYTQSDAMVSMAYATLDRHAFGEAVYATDVKFITTTSLTGAVGLNLSKAAPNGSPAADGYLVLLRASGTVSLSKGGTSLVGETPYTATAPLSGFVHLTVVRSQNDGGVNLQVYVGDTDNPLIDYTDNSATLPGDGYVSLVTEGVAATFCGVAIDAQAQANSLGQPCAATSSATPGTETATPTPSMTAHAFTSTPTDTSAATNTPAVATASNTAMATVTETSTATSTMAPATGTATSTMLTPAPTNTLMPPTSTAITTPATPLATTTNTPAPRTATSTETSASVTETATPTPSMTAHAFTSTPTDTSAATNTPAVATASNTAMATATETSMATSTMAPATVTSTTTPAMGMATGTATGTATATATATSTVAPAGATRTILATGTAMATATDTTAATPIAVAQTPATATARPAAVPSSTRVSPSATSTSPPPTSTASGGATALTTTTATAVGATPAAATSATDTAAAAGSTVAAVTDTSVAGGVASHGATATPGTAGRSNGGVVRNNAPRITLSLTTARPGSLLTVYGSGFGCREQITLALNGEAVSTRPSVVTTGCNGSFTASFVAPNGLLNEANTVSAMGNHSRRAALAALSGIPRLAARFYFAGGVETSGEHAALALLNPDRARATVRLTFYTSSGRQLGATVSLAPHAHGLFPVARLARPGGSFGLALTADRQIAAQLDLTRPGKDGDSILGNTGLGQTWYLAEGYTGLTFHEWVSILNPGSRAARVHLHLLPFGGRRGRTVTVPVGAHSHTVVDVNRLLPGAALSIVARSNQPVVIERTLTFSHGGYGLTARAGTNVAATSWVFAEGSTTNRFQTFLTLLNPNDQRASVTAVFFGSDDRVLATRRMTMAPRSRGTVLLNKVLRASGVASVVTSSQPIIVERTEYFGSPNAPGIAGSDVFGRNGTGVRWSFPDGDTGRTSSEFLLLYNPSPTTVGVDVTVYGANGRTETKRVFVPATARYTLNVNALFGGIPSAHGATLQAVRPGQGFMVEQTVFAPDHATLQSTQGLAQ